jgi:hypothetical protein
MSVAAGGGPAGRAHYLRRSRHAGDTLRAPRLRRTALRSKAGESLSANVPTSRSVGRPHAHGGPEGVAGETGLVVLGLSDRRRQEGLGAGRLAVARAARPATLLVRGGVRPGGLALRESMTRYTWSLGSLCHAFLSVSDCVHVYVLNPPLSPLVTSKALATAGPSLGVRPPST